MTEQPKRLLFVLNPIAGGIDKSQLPDTLSSFCRMHDVTGVILYTEKDGRTDSILEAIGNFAPDVVVAVGGDGTVHQVGKVLLNKSIPLGIIPMGSSNALAKNLNIPLTIEAALQNIMHAHTRAIDTLYINEHHCLHICDIGINARLIEGFEKRSVRGMGSYAISLFKELSRFRFFRYEVRSGNEDITGKAFSITITNTQIYGTRAAINPRGKMDDGKFEICIIRPFPKWMIVPLTIRLFFRTLHVSKYSIYIRTRKAVLLNPGHESVHIDGEMKELPEKIELVENPRSLVVVVPGGK